MPLTRAPRALLELRRYQRMLMYGGGAIVTLVIVAATVFDCVSTVRGYLDSEERSYVVDKSLVMDEVEASEATFRNALFSAELVWREDQHASAALTAAFLRDGNIALVQPYANLHPQLTFGLSDRTYSPETVSRYLGLASQLARVSTASSLMRNRALGGYHYSVEHDLMSLVQALPTAQTPVTPTLMDRERLMNALRVDPGDWRETPSTGAMATRRPVRWLPPRVNPLTHERTVRIVGAAFDDGKPFEVLVTEYPPAAFLAPLVVDQFGGTFAVFSQGGELITAASQDARDPVDMTAALMRMALSRPAGKSVEIWHEGNLLIADQLADTGWILVYTLSWRDLARGVAPQIGTTLGTTVAILAVLWTFLAYFNRRVFIPIFDRSQRVFDSEQLSRSLIDTAPVGLGLFSIDRGIPLLRSPLMESMAARVKVDTPSLSAEFARRYARAVDARAAEAPPAGGAAEQHAAVVREDVRIPLQGGGEVDLALSLARARYQGDNVLVIAFTDITDKKFLEQQLRDAKQAADSANAAKSAFLASMSHEIRTPLNAILGNLELLSLSPLAPAQHDRLATVRTSSDTLLALISDILDFSKIEAGQMALESIPFDMVEVVGRALNMFAPAANAKGLDLFPKFDTPMNVSALGDPVRVGQIINNLLSNAIKFTQTGHVSLRLSEAASIVPIARGDASSRRVVVIDIEDTGIGISLTNQKELFGAFAQGDVSINRRFGGTGLGLALCKRLVEAMSGHIGIESTPGTGTRFTVRLPVSVPPRHGTEADMSDRRSGSETTSEADLEADLEADSEANIDLTGQHVVVLAWAPEWHAFALPLFATWGLSVSAFRHPALVDDTALGRCDALIICGEPGTWHTDDEQALMSRVDATVRCRAQAPMHPVRQGDIIDVSPYSPQGLRAAIVEAVHGESAPLPLAVAPPVAAGEARRGEANAPRATPWPMPLKDRFPLTHGLRVLVAEDNIVNQALFTEQLHLLGCTSHVLPNGAATLASLESSTWDVLLTDLNMPVMSGYELAEAVRARLPGLPIIAVTAHASSAERDRCGAAGMHDVLTKPLSLGGLYEALRFLRHPPADTAAAESTAASAPHGAGALAILGARPLPASLRETFRRSCDVARKTLDAAWRNKDAGALLAELHSLKGSLGIFGQTGLAAECMQIEQRIEADGLSALGEALTLLDQQLARLASDRGATHTSIP